MVGVVNISMPRVPRPDVAPVLGFSAALGARAGWWWALAARGPRERERARRVALLVLAAPVLLACEVPVGAWFGFRSTHRQLQQLLPVEVVRPGIRVFMRPATPPALEQRVADHHAYRRQQIEGALSQRFSREIHSYVFLTSKHRRAAAGAPTMFAKPMLRAMYLHGVEPWSAAIPHEMVHLLAAEFAPPLGLARTADGGLNPSMLEGLAQAATPAVGPLEKHEEAGLMMLADHLPHLSELLGDSRGFTLRPAHVAYTAAGSFVDFFLDIRGPEVLKNAYRDGLEPAALKTLDFLWRDFLRKRVRPLSGTSLRPRPEWYPSMAATEVPYRLSLPDDVLHLSPERLEIEAQNRLHRTSGERERLRDRAAALIWLAAHGRPAGAAGDGDLADAGRAE